MVNLRFLSICGDLREDKQVMLHLQGGVNHIMWRQLRLLEWWGCSMRCMPSNFPAENLVELIMPDSHFEKLWEGARVLKSLKKMDLRRSKKLKEFPDLSKATSLEEMYLGDCWSLEKIPSSIQNLNRLRKLDMKSCKKLQALPTNIHLESLYSLNLSGCSQLKSFPRISKNISYLYLDETEIEEVPGWVEDISGLNYIMMNGCSNLKYISPNISKLKHLEVVFCSNSDSLNEDNCYDSPSSVTTKADNIDTRLPDASSSLNWKNDVFISFCWRDVRKTFMSHFYNALRHNSLEVMGRRDQSHELVNWIRESRIAIVVLSENYTSLSWCLDELVEIMKCVEEIGQKVIPIFYDVDPSHIKKQILKLGKTFEKTCENNTVDKQPKWVRALTILNQLHGYHSKNWDSEAYMIDTITDDISLGLNFTPKEISHVVEIDHMAKMKLLMCLESEKVRMLGVVGPPGTGKSTISRALFNQLSCQFQSGAFVDKVLVQKTMEQYGRDNLDYDNIKLRLQTQFLSQILEKKNNNHSSVGGKRVQDMKVLIVIDDVDGYHVVLEALAGQTQLFGSGSRILVITNDKELLRAHGIEIIYEVDSMSLEESLEILCRSAFLQTSPPEGFRNLAVEVTKLASLNVLGSYSRVKTMEEWLEMLPKIRNSVDQETEKALIGVYNGLNEKEKALFRHIACFLNNETYENVMRLLQDSELEVRISLKILFDKSLIQISEERVISMHHVLTKIGRDIVLAPFIHQPAKRQLLMDTKEGCDVLIDQTGGGAENVLGISFKVSEMEETMRSDKRFKAMKKLQFMRMYKERLYDREVRFHLVKGLHSLRHSLNLT